MMQKLRFRSRDYIIQQIQGVFQRLPTPDEEKRSMLSVRKIIPNSLTILALMTGLSSVPLALRGEYALSVFGVFIAGLLDGLDGPAARFLNSTSRFGAELDSLCDLVNFGVAPSFVIYLWRLHTLGWHGWLVSVLWSICMSCRLARFNAGVDFNQEKWSRSFFMGVPAPAGACLVLAPLVAALRFGTQHALVADRIVVPYIVFVAFMLISDVPTFSSKMINAEMLRGTVRRLLALLLAALFVVCVYADLWLTYLGIALLYVLSFPVSFFQFHRLAMQNSDEMN